MPRYSYDRLTALDNSFLLLEKPHAYMHVASTGIYALGPLKTPEGGVDIELLKRGITGVLHRIPRYRQKLAWIPLERQPVWVDDDRFNLDYHLRHASLPRPGDEEQLKRLSARVMGQRLDRTRPLWEMWIVEGLEGDRFALISKVHHCMIDGVSGVDLMTVLMSTEVDAEIPEAPPFVPRPEPSGFELLRNEIGRRIRLPFEAARDVRNFLNEARDARREFLSRLRATAETVGTTLRRASATPLNQRVGPHRHLDWATMELREIKELRRALGGSLNDVVLAIATGAVRRFLQQRRVDPAELDFRALAPVSVRTEDEGGKLGNRVSAWIVPLPVGESDPLQQLKAISRRTAKLKKSKQAVGAEVLTQAAEWTPATLLSLGARNATRLLPFNLVVTNIPGPQVPLYLLGAKMEQIYPYVPLADNLGLGIALFSYDGTLAWGFNADYGLVPDLDQFVQAIRDSFQQLRGAAGVVSAAPKRRKPARSRKASRVNGGSAPAQDESARAGS
jgi:WS/DGAT/MGAT family acyltransferase